MGKSFVSPGVFTKETDASFLGAGVGTIGAAILGTAPMGPAFVPVTVTNADEYISWFGDLDPDHMMGYAAQAYLRNAGSANFVRILGPEGRSANGQVVTPGYTAESMWAISAFTGSIGAIMALLEVTASAGLVVTDLGSDMLFLSATNSSILGVGVTASFLTGSSNYISKVLNTDPTLFSSKGYYVRDVYDYAVKNFANGNASFWSASFGITNFQRGFNSGSTPWIKSQLFGGTEYNLFRFHTLGHGEVENGRVKISISNIRPSSAPGIIEYGKFDVEVRDFGDTDRSKIVLDSFSNVSLDPTDPNYILTVIGDRFLTYDVSRNKMVEHGNYGNGSKYIRVELSTEAFPQSALPWGFKGLAKPALMAVSGAISDANGLKDLPYVSDLLDKETQAEATNTIYWGLETILSGSVKSRMTWLPTMTGSDADFSLTNVSGSALYSLVYNSSNPAGSKKSPGDTTSHTSLANDVAKFTVPVAFGFDGFDRRIANPIDNNTQLLTVSQLGTQAVRQAIDIISDPDFIDINLLLIPGVFSARVTDYAMDKSLSRADVFYIMDITGSNVDSAVQGLKNRGLDNNYAACYYPGVNVKDTINSKIVSVPASVMAAGAVAYNDRIAYPWYAPAGLNRAGLSPEVVGFEVTSMLDQLTQDERDKLYENRINPIARFPDVPQGVIWGQKTLQLRSSALDRINVRRLLIRAKKLVASAAKFLVFEPANATTMTRFKQLVNPILADIQIKQGLEKFLVVMDETNNPPELIDRNMLSGKIYLVPTKSAEFISIDFIVSKTGASFSE